MAGGHAVGDGRWVWVVVLVVLVAVAVLAVRRRPTRPVIPDDPNALMAALADEAVHRARAEFGVGLDFGPEPVGAVEELLGKLHARRAGGEMTDARLHREAMTWGAYVGEVIRRLKGGRWEKDHAVAGPESYPIHYPGHQSFPVAWCGKRIVNGDEDNVWHKFQVLTLGEAQGGIVIDGGPGP
jgi:hypothetical protein